MGSSVQESVQTTITRMPNIKLTYFDLRARAEPCRLLLAYGGLQYEDERIPASLDLFYFLHSGNIQEFDNKFSNTRWGAVKPTMPYSQLPLLQWGDQVICQSMACARFIAREVGLAGNNNMESAQVDEIIDVIQDLINAGVKLFFAKDEAGLKKHAEVTVPTALGQLETKLTSRGGQFFVGNNFSWADLHTFMYVSDLPDKSVLKSFPKIANLVERVGNIPNIKKWVETRPVTAM